MKKWIACLIAAFFMVVGVCVCLPSRSVSAQPQGQPTGCVVPKAWGQYKGQVMEVGHLKGAYAFEDPAGNLRFVDNSDCQDGKTTVALGIRRQ